jgi:hypothetical protein
MDICPQLGKQIPKLSLYSDACVKAVRIIALTILLCALVRNPIIFVYTTSITLWIHLMNQPLSNLLKKYITAMESQKPVEYDPVNYWRA